MNQRVKLIGIGALLLPVITFVSLNVTDYLRFSAAVNRAKRLTEEQLRTLAEVCRRVESHSRVLGTEGPKEFQSLKAERISMSPGLSYASLYSLGGVYLEFRVETTARNQRIYFFTNSGGPQETVILWDKSPALRRETDPDDRIVSIAGYGLGFYREWIVLRERIIVVDRPGTIGSEDALVAVAPLDGDKRSAIERLSASVQSEIGGMVFHAPVSDGIAVAIRFPSKGRPDKEGIVLHNAWNEKVDPLVDAVSQASPSGFPIEYGARIAAVRRTFPSDEPISVSTVAEWRNEKPRTPWWCVWRRLFHKPNDGINPKNGSSEISVGQIMI